MSEGELQTAADRFRGSRSHIIELLDDADCHSRLNSLLRVDGVQHGSIASADTMQPQGRNDVAEWEVENFVARHFKDHLSQERLKNWWLPDQPRLPKGATWDLLSTCTIASRPGLLLVEAKAHEGEVGRAGKSIPSGSEQSAINDTHIRSRLAEITEDLRSNAWNVDLSADRHYQLSNRLAWAWKLASEGVPVILLYLGFTGDTYFKDFIRDRDHWQRTMGAYMHGVVPLNMPDQIIPTEKGGSLTFLIRSMDVASPSS